MPKVPKLNIPTPPKPTTEIICAHGKLTQSDLDELEKYKQFRKERFERQQKGKK